MIYLYIFSFPVCLYVHFYLNFSIYLKIRGWPVSVCSVLCFRCEIMERYKEDTGSCKSSFILVSKLGARQKMIFSLGQRPIIIVPIDSYCNLPPKQYSFVWGKTHSGPQHIQQTRDLPRPCTNAAKIEC